MIKQTAFYLAFALAFVSCDLFVNSNLITDRGPGIVMDISELAPAELISTVEPSAGSHKSIKGINRVLICAVKDGVHVWKNHSIEIKKVNGRLVSEFLKLAKGELELGMLVLVDDSTSSSYLVKPKDHGSIKILIDKEEFITLSKESYILQMDTDSDHGNPTELSDFNHSSHTAHPDCTGDPWCLFPDAPVPPVVTQALWLQVMIQNPNYDPDDPFSYFLRSPAFYHLFKGTRTISSGALGSWYTQVPWDGSTGNLTLLVEKPGYGSKYIWFDATDDSGSLGNGMVDFLRPRLDLDLPLLVTLLPDSGNLAANKVTWDRETFSGPETWKLHFIGLNNNETRSPIDLDLSGPGGVTFGPLTSDERVVLSGPETGSMVLTKFMFWKGDTNEMGTWLFAPSASGGTYVGTMSFKDEGALPELGYGPIEYTTFFLNSRADLFTLGSDKGLVFNQAGQALFPVPMGWD